MMDFIDKIMDWYNDKEQEGLREIIDTWKTWSLITMGLLTISYWAGHPEWVLNKNCCNMIIKNCKKD